MRPYMNPYLAGVGVGLALLAAFVLAGRGLGATGGYSAVVAAAADSVAGDHIAQSTAYQAFFGDSAPMADWLVFELLGVLAGALASAWISGRFHFTVEHGNAAVPSRLMMAFAGGLLMGYGAKLARGCTSGQGLTGGATYSISGWLFIACAFAAAYAIAPLATRAWRTA